jgi:hypothetical protein
MPYLYPLYPLLVVLKITIAFNRVFFSDVSASRIHFFDAAFSLVCEISLKYYTSKLSTKVIRNFIVRGRPRASDLCRTELGVPIRLSMKKSTEDYASFYAYSFCV